LSSLRIRPPDARPGQIIGIMGGSFNPPHEGHLLVAATALRRLRLDRLWWLVSPGNPLKEHAGLAPLAERIEACRRLTRDPRIEVSGFEMELGWAYTVDTLAFLHARFPATRFIWVMGADNLAQIHRWKDWRRIAATTPLAVVDRPGWRLKAFASPAAHTLASRRLSEERAAGLAVADPPAWVFLTSRLSKLSSTRLRGGAHRRAVSKK
jgi:nicotinate-nucleotide adenylyltransferase